MHDAARDFLAEFGNISVNVRGEGVSYARAPFTFDPLLADGEEGRFLEWSGGIGESIYPIGMLEQVYFLGIGESGRVYIVADWLARFRPMPLAIEDLILGIAAESLDDS